MFPSKMLAWGNCVLIDSYCFTCGLALSEGKRTYFLTRFQIQKITSITLISESYPDTEYMVILREIALSADFPSSALLTLYTLLCPARRQRMEPQHLIHKVLHTHGSSPSLSEGTVLQQVLRQGPSHLVECTTIYKTSITGNHYSLY